MMSREFRKMFKENEGGLLAEPEAILTIFLPFYKIFECHSRRSCGEELIANFRSCQDLWQSNFFYRVSTNAPWLWILIHEVGQVLQYVVLIRI